MHKTLEGIRILDFTQFLSGPFCTMNLADFGAEVIKIERPDTGDVSRTFGPFVNGQSSYYTLINRGKKGITLDLKRGREIVLEMVKSCDVLTENFKPGVMERLGLSYEDVSTVNPGIIYCSISGFGQTSPYRSLRSYDVVAQGMSGLMNITGYPDDLPARAGCSVGDLSAGMYAVTAILLALYEREKSGKGQRIDIAMLDTTFAFLETNVVRYTIGGIHPQRVGARHPISAPFDLYRCSDGMVIIAVASNPHFEILCRMIGRAELSSDPRFDTDSHRSANDKELRIILEQFLKDYSVEEAVSMMEEHGIPCGPLCSVEDACQNESILQREMLVEIDQPGMGEVKITGNPVKMSVSQTKPQDAAPKLGQNNLEIFRDTFGFTQDQIRKLEKEHII